MHRTKRLRISSSNRSLIMKKEGLSVGGGSVGGGLGEVKDVLINSYVEARGGRGLLRKGRKRAG